MCHLCIKESLTYLLTCASNDCGRRERARNTELTPIVLEQALVRRGCGFSIISGCAGLRPVVLAPRGTSGNDLLHDVEAKLHRTTSSLVLRSIHCIYREITYEQR